MYYVRRCRESGSMSGYYCLPRLQLVEDISDVNPSRPVEILPECRNRPSFCPASAAHGGATLIPRSHCGNMRCEACEACCCNI